MMENKDFISNSSSVIKNEIGNLVPSICKSVNYRLSIKYV